MHELFSLDSGLTSAHSMAPSTDNTLSWWTSTGSEMQQSTLPRNLSFKMAASSKPFQNGKQLGVQSHNQDSSSTQSTGQSYPEVAMVGESKSCGKSTISKESGSYGEQGKAEECNSYDYIFPPSHVDHSQSYGRAPFTCSDAYSSGFVAAYGAHPMVHPQMMCMASNRVALPLHFPQEEPILVNPKQYHAILRQRQKREKLEAQNKVVRNRKPYLHESRHRHALSRPRGPGGRFLNEKKLQESKTTAVTGWRDNSQSGQSQLTSKGWECEFHQLGNYKGVEPTTSSSDITSPSHINHIFQPQQLGFSFYPPHVMEPVQHDRGTTSGSMHHHLFAPR